jgi:protein-S-isoprenylcysteine O-methyltransferase Ste14
MHQARELAWLICGIYATIPAYWLMVHPFATRWRYARRKLSVLGPLWMLLWCAAWAVSAPWRQSALYEAPALWLAAPLFWSASALLYVRGGRELTLRRLIGVHELESARPQQLVTHGIHARLRHPLYLGHICTMLGWTLGAGTVACAGLLAVALVSGAVMLASEERELHARFGPAWEQYCRRTPRLLPRIGG